MEPHLEVVTRVSRGMDGAQSQSAVPLTTRGQWFPAYRHRLAQAGLSDAALQVLSVDSDYIVSQGVFGAGDPANLPTEWPESRLRRGLVVGAVQSGKTASMLAVAAMAVDRGVDVVVFLTGTRKALYLQTFFRACAQFDGWDESKDGDRRTHRVLIPSPAQVYANGLRAPIQDIYYETPNVVRRRLENRTPLIAFVMKHSDHLMCFGRWLRRTLAVSGAVPRPMHLLMIDDEADDGSILDAVVEAGLGADSDRLKQIPRHIAHVWSGQGPNHTTFDTNLFATYLAYTATPQANFLQSDHNPLAPTDFLASLRTPYDRGAIASPRSSTYAESEGLCAYYTGGDIFYNRFAHGREPFVHTAEFPDPQLFPTPAEHRQAVDSARYGLLEDALRSYFVAVACSLYVSGKSMTALLAASPASRDVINALKPNPLCALVHPSAQLVDHFEWAEIISAWSVGLLPGGYELGDLPRDAEGRPELCAQGLAIRLATEEGLWAEWLNRFEQSRIQLATLPRGDLWPPFTMDKWPQIKRLLLGEVFGNVRLSVINADPEADDRPCYEPRSLGKDQFDSPLDIFTIFVSGNVMSRGVTLEGLCTTTFLRPSSQPAADTQMQMQRWFGYRGKILPWCRLFAFQDQANLFRAYHETDESLRRAIISVMNEGGDRCGVPTVLQGDNFCATSKIANIRTLPLCPGSSPFVRVVDQQSNAPHNAGILEELLRDNPWQQVIVQGVLRGLAMPGRQLTLLEVADYLDRFRYDHHDPDPLLPENSRWLSLQHTLALERDLFCPPGLLLPHRNAVAARACPYSIAAYLRLWSFALRTRAPGFFPTDDPQTPWSLIDLNTYARASPRFYVGIRFGESGLTNNPGLASHGIYAMQRQVADGVLTATWGSRNPGMGPNAYLGDELFDYHVHHRTPPERTPGEPLWRPRGEPGLLLFHVVRTNDTVPDAVTVGLSLPQGGPDQFAALRPFRRP
jgi:hypothetical protein